MKCSDLQDKVSLHVDGSLPPAEATIIEQHFVECPLCREMADDLRALKLSLRQLDRPAISQNTARRVRIAVREHAKAKRQYVISPLTLDWLQMRVLPLTVGLGLSVIIGISFLAAMMSGGLAIDHYTARNLPQDLKVMVDTRESSSIDHNPYNDISALEFARNRVAFAEASPSINPRGTLATLSNKLSRQGSKDEVVVVADVDSNGSARIAEVVEASGNSRAIADLQRALDANFGEAPFVPASMDHRSGSVRVILKFQSVEVNSRNER